MCSSQETEHHQVRGVRSVKLEEGIGYFAMRKGDWCLGSLTKKMRMELTGTGIWAEYRMGNGKWEFKQNEGLDIRHDEL